MPLVGVDWSQIGVAHLFTAIKVLVIAVLWLLRTNFWLFLHVCIVDLTFTVVVNTIHINCFVMILRSFPDREGFHIVYDRRMDINYCSWVHVQFLSLTLLDNSFSISNRYHEVILCHGLYFVVYPFRRFLNLNKFVAEKSLVCSRRTQKFVFHNHIFFQDGIALPDGPVVISPDGLFPSLFREGRDRWLSFASITTYLHMKCRLF